MSSADRLILHTLSIDRAGLLKQGLELVDVIVDNKPQFAECEYPAETDWQKSRLQILHNVGWKRIEIPYIQPALKFNSEPLDDLALLLKSSKHKVSLITVVMFLLEFYNSLGAPSEVIKKMLNDVDYDQGTLKLTSLIKKI